MDARKSRNLWLEHRLSPGDVLVLTATIESLTRQYPGKFKIAVDTTCPDIWNNNPHISQLIKSECHVIEMQYPLINESHLMRTGHFMNAFCKYLEFQIQTPLSLQVNKPYLYLTTEEKSNRLVDGKYIIVNAGTKDDLTCKGWGRSNYQEVVNRLKYRFTFVQIGEAHHFHKPLDGVLNFIGKTNTRELFSLCYNSVAGIGPVTFLQHIMAAFNKPYVCLAGGREPFSWIWYPTQAILSTQGQLSCCSPNACWKSRVVPLEDGKNDSLCVLPVIKDGEYIPKCMEMISPNEVINELQKFIDGKMIK